jgi:hypothetical protein
MALGAQAPIDQHQAGVNQPLRPGARAKRLGEKLVKAGAGCVRGDPE